MQFGRTPTRSFTHFEFGGLARALQAIRQGGLIEPGSIHDFLFLKMARPVSLRIEDIWGAVEKAGRYAGNMTAEIFCADAKTVGAFMQNPEIRNHWSKKENPLFCI